MEIKIPAILKFPRSKIPYGVESTRDENLFQIKYPFPNILSSLNVTGVTCTIKWHGQKRSL
jgi:hypothetical protein